MSGWKYWRCRSLSMHYQNISSFGFLSLARKRASLVLPFNKVMDTFFFYLWLLIWTQNLWQGDQSCSIRGLAEIVLQITSDMSSFVFFFFPHGSNHETEAGMLYLTWCWFWAFRQIHWLYYAQLFTFFLKDPFVSLYLMFSCFELTRSKKFALWVMNVT
jgi:hypothetical protein